MTIFHEAWADPTKRKIILAAIGGTVVVAMAMSMSEDNTSKRIKQIERMETPIQKNGSLFGASDALSEISTRDANNMVDTMAQNFEKKERELSAREAEMDRRNEQMQARQMESDRKLTELQLQLEAMAKGQGTVTADRRNPNARNGAKGQVPTQANGQSMPMNQPQFDQYGNVINTNQRQIVTPNSGQGTGGQVIRTVTQRHVREFKDGTVNERPIEIHTLNARTQRSAKPAIDQYKEPLNYEEEDGVELFTLSMGSIISGTLLNGVAAPTSSDRKNEPMPVLMRVKREAIMPNFYTLDIIDCHMLGSAIGDLASNRAYIRAEAISCNTANGESIEKPITAYAVSSTDGMAGVAGDVVFKSGAMIANSLKASFIQGFAEAFSPRRVQSLNTSPGATELWQSQNLDRAGGAGIGQGVSSAAERIADKYMDMADAAQPVIELVPGIEVDFIVQKGMTLKLGGRKAPYTGNRMGDQSVTQDLKAAAAKAVKDVTNAPNR